MHENSNIYSSQYRKWNLIMYKNVKLYQLWSKFIKKKIKNHRIPCYNIQKQVEVIKDVFLSWQKFWAFDELFVFTIWVISQLCMINDFTF